VLELEEERGVAHIVEHLAFSATRRYSNHDIVRFLESVGAEFGACQNASTSHDETIYELVVPIDKPELLPQAISILAEFSTEVSIWFHKLCHWTVYKICCFNCSFQMCVRSPV
jgi:predicted Zn-dependent peptidase